MMGISQERGGIFAVDDEGLIVQNVGRENQIVIPHRLRGRVPYMNHYPVTSAHPGGRKMYASLLRNFYCPGLALDCYTTSEQFESCAKDRVLLLKNKKLLHLSPAHSALEFGATDILGRFLRSRRKNVFVLMITDRYCKLTKAIPMKK